MVVLGVLVLLGMGAGIVNNRLRAGGRSSPFLAPVSSLLYPFQSASGRVQGWASANWNALFRGRELERENVGLRAENGALKQENEKLRNAQDEAERLRNLLHYEVAQKNEHSLVAPVIAWLPTRSYDTLTLGAGTRSGIRQKSIVRTPGGLVGQVVEAGPFSSQVLLLTDLQFGVGALVKRSGKTKSDGIVQGTGRGRLLEMVDLKHEDDVVKGDVVVSSGYGGVVPPGVPIGIVASVSEDATHYLKVARVQPFIPPPGDLREVLVVVPQDAQVTAPLPLPGATPALPTPTPAPRASPPNGPVPSGTQAQ